MLHVKNVITIGRLQSMSTSWSVFKGANIDIFNSLLNIVTLCAKAHDYVAVNIAAANLTPCEELWYPERQVSWSTSGRFLRRRYVRAPFPRSCAAAANLNMRSWPVTRKPAWATSQKSGRIDGDLWTRLRSTSDQEKKNESFVLKARRCDSGEHQDQKDVLPRIKKVHARRKTWKKVLGVCVFCFCLRHLHAFYKTERRRNSPISKFWTVL